MSREFTTEMLKQVEEMDSKVKGTSCYGAYYVPFEAKNTSGRWYHLGWHTANRTGTIKNVKGKFYVYYKDGFGNDYRYALTPIYIKMFNLEVA